MNPFKNKFLSLSIWLLGTASTLIGQPQLLDDFESLAGWRALPSQGARLTLTNESGKTGKALVLNYELSGVYGYTIAQKDFPLDLPNNYQFTFDMRAEAGTGGANNRAPVNNFEFKLLDENDNVFWIKKLNVEYPTEWTKQRIKKRHITFAWGPQRGGEIRRVARIEFVVSTATGGSGKVFIDNFTFEPIDDDAAKNAIASFDASSMSKGGEPTVDEKGTIVQHWKSAGNQNEWLSINFNAIREVGGLVIDWDDRNYASAYDVEFSDDGKEWFKGYSVVDGNGGRDFLYLHEQQGRMLRLLFKKSAGKVYGIARMEVKGPEFGASPNDFFSRLAGEEPKGLYPKYFLQQQCNWTVVGASGDAKEALVSELGAIETDRLGFSLEPFLFIDNKLLTWSDVTVTQSLESDYLPIPSIQWRYGDWQFTIRAFVAGGAGRSMLIATYRIENIGGSSSPEGKLFIALRPFQVNPPWQWLNIVGGFAKIDSIRNNEGIIQVNDKTVIAMKAPSGFGATSFDRGDITDFLKVGSLPTSQAAYDARGFTSGAIAYEFNVHPGSHEEFHIAVPFHRYEGSPTSNMGEGADLYISLAHSATRLFWESKLDRFQITLPSSAQKIINTIKSNIAYIFINRDGPGIQPGSRSYERSWIRDGSLTSAAMLQLGIQDEVREFADWYATYQFESGKVPCVVDSRGADATDEHDSHGQLIYLVKEYFNFTRDTTWLRSKFQNIEKAVQFIKSLRSERKTDLYRTGTTEQRACYGLVPESISHEGYSDHPRHSYWDDFFVLKGLKDAAAIAGILGEAGFKREFSRERDDFRKDLYSSMKLTMRNHNISYIPGCVELGDFDATSTTIGVNPCGELGNIPEPELHKTFDKWYEFFRNRRDNKIDWKDYTPYENRIIGTFVYLDQKQRAHEALEFFMKDRRPPAFNHWAEVVHRDPATPKFIGDMPHTWCGSDFIRSVRAMFAYEREHDNALVIGAGLADEWVNDSAGVKVTSLPTYFGNISYSIKKEGRNVVVVLGGDVKVPSGSIILKSPLSKRIQSVLIDGKKGKATNGKEVVVKKLPSTLLISY
ncbi:MAG TPA: discoidin domain-containing protein [Bacteroidota bacterium]